MPVGTPSSAGRGTETAPELQFGETAPGIGASYFLPNFCSILNVLVLVVGAEVVAILLVLAAAGGWAELGRVSLFLQWVSLLCALALCLSRRWMRTLAPVGLGLTALGLVLGVTLLCTELAFRLLPVGPTAVPDAHGAVLARNLAIAAIVGILVLRYLYVQHQWKRRVQSEAQARFEALQARIRPHFLFNSLNTIASLAGSDPEAAESATEDLAQLFRANLGGATQASTLADELELCRRYLSIEKLRLGDRLQTEWDVEEVPEEALLPALILQPLVENAIYHGIEQIPEGGRIRISGRTRAGRVCVGIENPVAGGAAPERSHGNKIARENIAQRLQALYARSASLEVREHPGRYQVEVCWPLQRSRLAQGLRKKPELTGGRSIESSRPARNRG